MINTLTECCGNAAQAATKRTRQLRARNASEMTQDARTKGIAFAKNCARGNTFALLVAAETGSSQARQKARG